jgi:Ni,Fe-hydrogenase III large subunit/Ni,Fe-hydrogenase III component G
MGKAASASGGDYDGGFDIMNYEVIRVERDKLAEVYVSALEPDFRECRLLTMVAGDEPETKGVKGVKGAEGTEVGRFVLRYFFATGKERITVLETVVPEADPAFASLAAVLPAASWYEREAQDLFGVRPLGHPDPRRLVLHEAYPDGMHPLRKDFPLEGMRPNPVADRTVGSAAIPVSTLSSASAANRSPAPAATLAANRAAVSSLTPAASGLSGFVFPQVRGEGVFEIPVGPIHAGVIEPGHFRFQVMGDSILHLETRLFYTHRGVEKRAEGMHVLEGARLAERVCGVCSVSHGLSYAQAIERIGNIDVPERALFLRSLAGELERLYNHVSDMSSICSGIGYAYGSAHGARWKETLMQMNGRLIGHRYLRGFVTPGGVMRDLTDGQLEEIRRMTHDVMLNIEQIVRDMKSNNIAMDRLQRTGILRKDIAEAFAVVGPAARASGLDLDARRDFRYAAYRQLRFDVPLMEEGDVLSRLLIRVKEAKQSTELIRQIAERIPSGAIHTMVGDLPPYQYALGISESPRGDNVHYVLTGPNNTIYRYRIRSASYANWPVVAACAPGNIVPDFPLINKSFELCYACCDR